MLVAFIAAIAVGALRAIAGGSRVVEQAIDSKATQRYPIAVLKDDLQNLYRDVDFKQMHFDCQYEEDGSLHLKFYTVSDKKARQSGKEADVYEAEYFISSSQDGSYLMRRYWPNPSDEAQSGGILSVIGENIIMFDVQMWDGKEWVEEWLIAEQKSLPAMLEVNLWFWRGGKDRPTRRSFLLSWPRTSQPALNNEDEPFGFEDKEIIEPEI